MSRHETKAEELMKAGDKAQKKWFGGNSKFENAGEAYTKAGLSFKLAKNWDKAAEAYKQASEMLMKCENESQSASAMVEAGNMYLKGEKKPEYVEQLEAAAEIYEGLNRLSTAAKLHKQMAEMYEMDLEHSKACHHYKTAAELFATDNSESSANQCYVKVALFLGEGDETKKEAADMFEDVGKKYLKNNLLKFNARAQFLNACLCHLANDDKIGCRRAYDQYKEIDFQFADSRECKLVESVLGAYEDQDMEAFMEALTEYDRVSKLDPWRTKVLLRIKEAITESAEPDLS